MKRLKDIMRWFKLPTRNYVLIWKLAKRITKLEQDFLVEAIPGGECDSYPYEVSVCSPGSKLPEGVCLTSEVGDFTRSASKLPAGYGLNFKVHPLAPRAVYGPSLEDEESERWRRWSANRADYFNQMRAAALLIMNNETQSEEIREFAEKFPKEKVGNDD